MLAYLKKSYERMSWSQSVCNVNSKESFVYLKNVIAYLKNEVAYLKTVSACLQNNSF
jgi:hypothetical protein